MPEILCCLQTKTHMLSQQRSLQSTFIMRHNDACKVHQISQDLTQRLTEQNIYGKIQDIYKGKSVHRHWIL